MVDTKDVRYLDEDTTREEGRSFRKYPENGRETTSVIENRRCVPRIIVFRRELSRIVENYRVKSRISEIRISLSPMMAVKADEAMSVAANRGSRS